MPIVPVIEAADAISNGNNSNDASPDLTYPAHAAGDLLIQALASDADLNITAPANGPNGETITVPVNNAEPGGTGGPHFSVIWWKATNATNQANMVWGISGAGEQWAGLTIRVPNGEYDPTTPISANSAVGSNASNSAAATMPGFTTNATVANGRIVCLMGMDQVTTNGSANGWTSIETLDIGSIGVAAHVRNAAADANEAVSATNFALTANDTYVAYALVVAGVPIVAVNSTLDATAITANGTVANAVIHFALSASNNIPANANTATTAQLTAPANKSTNDFGAGWISDDTNPLPAVNTTANQYTELEWCIASGANVTTNHVYTFRVTANGTELDTYSANATWAIGEATGPSNGTVNQALAETAPTANATVAVTGSLTQTLASVSPSSIATVAVAAGVQQGLADAPLSAAATVLVSATVAQTLAETAISADGTVETEEPGDIEATVSQTLEATTPQSTGTVAVAATVSQTLAALTPSAAATVQVTATTSQTLAETAPTSTGTVAVKGTTAQTLAVTSPTANATVAVTGSVSQTLAATSIAANAAIGMTSAIVLATSSYIPANAATNSTGQLTPPSGKTVVADFQAGRISDDTNPLPSIDLVTNRYTELEWAVQATNYAVDTSTYQFRVTANGTAVNTYSVTPTLLYRVPVSANLAQALGDTTIAATAVQAEPDAVLGTVAVTLQNVTQDIYTVTGRAATVGVTLGNVSETELHCDTGALGGGTPTGYNFYFGRSSGIYTVIVPVAYTPDLTIRLAAIAPDTGEWYVMVRAYNADGESDPSNELFAVVPVFTATVTNPVGNATVVQTLGNTVGASAAKVQTHVTVAQTLGATTPSATGTVSVSATVSGTLGATTPSVTATVETHAQVEQTLGDTGCTAAGTIYSQELEATVTQTLEDTGCASTAVVYETGSRLAWVDQVLADAQAAVETDVLVQAESAGDLAGVGCSARMVHGMVQQDDNIYLGRKRR